ncbi:flippase, partial [Shigella sonnei]|nr:flippase [Shigella sonnei]
ALVVTSLGFNRILVRESTCCKDKISHNELISTSFYSRLLFSILIFALLWGGYSYIDNKNSIIYLISFLSVIFVSFDVIDYHLQGQCIFKTATLCRVVSFLIVSFIRIFLVFENATLIWFCITILFEYAISAILLYLSSRFIHRNIFTIKIKHVSLNKAKYLLKESWSEIIAGFGAILFMKMDQIMLQYMLNAESVGVYSAALRISESWYFLPAAIVSSVFPVIMNKYNKENTNESALVELFGHIMTLLVWLSICAAITISLFGPAVIHWLFGDEYIRSATILIYHVWAGVFLSMGILSGSWLVAKKKLKLNLYRNIGGLIVNFFLNIILIPVYSGVGAAIATISGFAFAFLFFDLFHKELRGMFFLKIKSLSPINLIQAIRFLSNIRLKYL